MTQPISLCTYFDKNYLAKGLALHSSLMRHHQDRFDLYVLALDYETYLAVKDLPHVWATELSFLENEYTPTRDLLNIKRTRSLVEYYWTLTPIFTEFSLRMSRADHLAYIDADCFLYHPLDSLYREVAEAWIAIIPHRFSPALAKTHSVNGTYNVGWVYFKNDPLAFECLETWSAQCLDWCYRRSEPMVGGGFRFADQGYLDEWVRLYGAHVVQHLGANLGPWNQMNYEYEWGTCTRRDESKRMFIIERAADGAVTRIDPLLFYHFHGLDLHVQKGSERFTRGGYPLSDEILTRVYEPYEYTVARFQREISKTGGKRKPNGSLSTNPKPVAVA